MNMAGNVRPPPIPHTTSPGSNTQNPPCTAIPAASNPMPTPLPTIPTTSARRTPHRAITGPRSLSEAVMDTSVSGRNTSPAASGRYPRTSWRYVVVR